MSSAGVIEQSKQILGAQRQQGGVKVSQWLRGGISVWVIALCVCPFLLVIAVSMGHKIEGAAWEWSFTLENYKRFFVGAFWPETTTFLYVKKLGFSIFYAVAAALLAVALAFPFTYLMTRQSRRAQTLWLVFLLSSLSLSEVFVVMGWDILLSNRSGLPALFREVGVTDWLKANGYLETLRGWGLANLDNVKFKTSTVATLLSAAYLVWPYGVILLYPGLSRMDRAMIEAARTMGARPWTVIWTVVLPSIRVPLVGTLMLLFVFLLGTYVTITVFADPASHTLAVSIYESVRGSTMDAPFGAAQSVVLLCAAGLVLGLGHSLSRIGKPSK